MRAADARDQLVEFEAGLPFKLDEFQREAIDKLERSRGGVLVSAPTSSRISRSNSGLRDAVSL